MAKVIPPFHIVLLILLTTCKEDLPVIVTSSVDNITNTTAISGGTIIDEGTDKVLERGVCWDIYPSPTIKNSRTEDGEGSGNFISYLTNLNSETYYYVRAYALNGIGIGYGDEKSFCTTSSDTQVGTQIIADHAVVDKYADIPQYYIDEVKKMWLVYAGESHAWSIGAGLLALESIDPRFAVDVVTSGTPSAYTTTNLRESKATWGDVINPTGWRYNYGEEDWFAYLTGTSYTYSNIAVERTKSGISYCNTSGPEVSAIGFGWCTDDYVTVGTYMGYYLTATQAYIDYCAAHGYRTKVFFTTCPMEDSQSTGVTGYDNYLRMEQIRDYVAEDANRILFDFADILCYDDAGSDVRYYNYNGNVYPMIALANQSPVVEQYHFSAAGALRLAKAMWWMLARIAGWDGE